MKYVDRDGVKISQGAKVVDEQGKEYTVGIEDRELFIEDNEGITFLKNLVEYVVTKNKGHRVGWVATLTVKGGEKQ